jgi:hypothetical protein
VGADAPGAANAADANKLKAMASAILAIDFCMTALFISTLENTVCLKRNVILASIRVCRFIILR